MISSIEIIRDQRRSLYDEFLGNLADLVSAGKVIPHKCNHAHPDLDVIPDMVFIDGAHDYVSVSRDIQTWMPRLRRGGLICGHDSGSPPVDAAVRQNVPSAVIAPGTTIWFATKS